MGWASYIEDMVTRYENSWHSSAQVINDEKTDVEKKLREANRVLNDARFISQEIRKNLELATDPSLDLAHEIELLKKEINDLRSEVGRKNSEIEGCRLKVNSLQGDLAEKSEQIDQIFRENEELKEMVLDEKESKESAQNKLEIERSLTPEMFKKFGEK